MNTTGNFLILNPSSAEFTQVLELDVKDFPKPWSSADWVSLNWDHHLLYAQISDQGLAAFALFAQVPGDDTAHLLKICVDQALRGTGFTQEFWKTCRHNLKLSEIKSIYLEVESPNQRAIGFYQKCGFQLLRKIKAYYSDGTDALTMQMTI
jgi:ribosomal-protein-alanine N-acetyltransferase